MEPQTSLIRTDGRVELNPVSGICLDFTIVINPGHLEGENTLRFDNALDNLGILELRMLVVNVLNRLQYFTYRLEIFLLVRVLGLK